MRDRFPALAAALSWALRTPSLLGRSYQRIGDEELGDLLPVCPIGCQFRKLHPESFRVVGNLRHLPADQFPIVFPIKASCHGTCKSGIVADPLIVAQDHLRRRGETASPRKFTRRENCKAGLTGTRG